MCQKLNKMSGCRNKNCQTNDISHVTFTFAHETGLFRPNVSYLRYISFRTRIEATPTSTRRNISPVALLSSKGKFQSKFWSHSVYTRATTRGYTWKCIAVALCTAPKGVAMRNPCNGSLSHEFMHVAADTENGILSAVISRANVKPFWHLWSVSRAVFRLTAAVKYASTSRCATSTLSRYCFNVIWHVIARQTCKLRASWRQGLPQPVLSAGRFTFCHALNTIARIVVFFTLRSLVKLCAHTYVRVRMNFCGR